jgi:hypothetical protein
MLRGAVLVFDQVRNLDIASMASASARPSRDRVGGQAPNAPRAFGLFRTRADVRCVAPYFTALLHSVYNNSIGLVDCSPPKNGYS